ncbi:transmembrane protein, putative (macronuclear) [Tetrahymena thermophila SB210]|uniref:Transmembrane protein, putative n=1 Tax=Tetrahymena thermophila (strain SB210) TaxID=312017 RepID=I7M9D9_TETTS|nr:transmembrane protein, putative [Tetrahymena thermophila SB210]EAS01403.2 transmembrane protein, putative [Tetrahymena thermophila SB210]|eukprot:XP_001021649.2 transmembrane protein, putative [Tetrahymena thermophila SB210]
MIFKLILLISLIDILIADCSSDANCLFCSKTSVSCLMCQQGFTINSSNICAPSSTCQYYQFSSSDQTQCLNQCPSTQIDFLNSSLQSNQCQIKNLCPQQYSISSTDNIISITPGVIYMQGQAIPVNQIQTQYFLDIVSIDTNMSIVKLTSNISNDLITGFKVNGNQSLGSCIVVWFQSSQLIAYSLQNSNQQTIVLQNIVAENNQILDAIVDISSTNGFNINLIAKQTPLKQLSYINILVNGLVQNIISTWSYTGKFGNVIKLFYINSSLIISLGVNSSQKFQSFSLQLTNGQLVEQDLCTLNSVATPAPKILLLKQNSEILYFASGNIYSSSFVTCYSQQISDQSNVLSLVLDESAQKCFSISANAINSYQYTQALGAQSLSQIPQVTINNLNQNIVACSSVGLIQSQSQQQNFMLICNNSQNNILSLLTYNFQSNVVNISNLFNNNFPVVNLIYAQPLATLVLQGAQQIRSFVGLQPVAIALQTSPNQGCIFLLQSQFEQSSNLQKLRINTIQSSLSNQISSDQKLIYQVINNINYNSQLDQITNIRQLQIVGTQQSNPIIINALSLIGFKFKSLKLMGINLQLQANSEPVTINQSQVNEFILDTIIFNSIAQNSTLIIQNKNSVIIRQAYFHNFTLINSTLITFINCNQIFFGSISIYNVTLSDQYSSLFKIIQSTQVTFNNTNITLSNLNIQPMIIISGCQQVNIQNVITAGNYFMNKLIFGKLFLIQGPNSIYISNLIIKSNMNVQTLQIVPYFNNSQNQFITNQQVQVVAANVIIRDNLGIFGQQIYVSSNSAFFSKVSAFNNSQQAANGTIYFTQNFVQIQDSNFTNNTAYGGGGIYFNQTQFAQLINCQLINNSANAAGGAILISKGPILLNKTIIQSNKAYIGGGVRIESGFLSYLQYDQQTIMSNNIALLFGDDVASRLQTFKIFINGNQVNEINQSEFLKLQSYFFQQAQVNIQNAYYASNIRSGQKLDILVQVFDQSGKILIIDPKISYPPTIALEINQLGGVLKSYIITFIGENFITDYCQDRQGFCLTSDLTVQGIPGKVLPLVLLENFIEKPLRQSSRILEYFEGLQEQIKIIQSPQKILKKRNLINFTSLLGLLTSSYTSIIAIQLQFRDCIKGEILKEINSQNNITECLPCPLNSYTLTNNDTQCLKCPDSAYLCQNYTILLKDGYWRQKNDTDEIYQCREDLGSCLFESTQQTCKKGYVGPLCQGCDLWGEQWGFSFTQKGINGACYQCDNQQKQVLYNCLIFIFTTFYLVFGVNNVIDNNNIHSLAYYIRILKLASISKSSLRDESSQYIKLLIHYLQLLAVLNSISLQLPDFVTVVPKFTGNPNTSFILSSNCFLQQLNYKNIMQLRVLQSSLLPLIYCFVVMILYIIYKLIKCQKIQKQFFYTTFVFLVMFFQPDSIMFLLSSIGCQNLGKIKSLIADANFECYKDSSYHEFLYFYTIPAFLIWCLFPVIFLILLSRRRNKLHLIVTKQMYGYLYLEYKEKYYYFEFFRCAIRIIIVVFQTLVNSDQQFKLNCVTLLLFFYLIVSVKILPYQNIQVFRVDVMSHVVLIIIVLFNMISATLGTSSSFNDIIQMLTVITNVGYFLVMICIIAFLKINNFNSAFLKLLIFMKKNFAKFIPCLKKSNLLSSNYFRVLKRWKLLRNNRQYLVQKYFQEQLNNHFATAKLINTKREIEHQSTIQAPVSIVIKDQKPSNFVNSPNQQSTPLIQSFPQQSERRILENNNNLIKGNQEQDLDIYSSGFLSQNLDAEKANLEIEMYSVPVSSKFIFDKNNLVRQAFNSAKQINPETQK